MRKVLSELLVGTDVTTGLPKWNQITQLVVDTAKDIVSGQYDVVLKSPTGEVVEILDTLSFKRTNTDETTPEADLYVEINLLMTAYLTTLSLLA